MPREVAGGLQISFNWLQDTIEAHIRQQCATAKEGCPT